MGNRKRVQFSSVQDGIYALRKAHMRFTQSLSSFPHVAFEMVPDFCLTDDGPFSSIQGRLSSAASFHASLLQARSKEMERDQGYIYGRNLLLGGVGGWGGAWVGGGGGGWGVWKPSDLWHWLHWEFGVFEDCISDTGYIENLVCLKTIWSLTLPILKFMFVYYINVCVCLHSWLKFIIQVSATVNGSFYSDVCLMCALEIHVCMYIYTHLFFTVLFGVLSSTALRHTVTWQAGNCPNEKVWMKHLLALPVCCFSWACLCMEDNSHRILSADVERTGGGGVEGGGGGR